VQAIAPVAFDALAAALTALDLSDLGSPAFPSGFLDALHPSAVVNLGGNVIDCCSDGGLYLVRLRNRTIAGGDSLTCSAPRGAEAIRVDEVRERVFLEARPAMGTV
jgi:hypothetical protein